MNIKHTLMVSSKKTKSYTDKMIEHFLFGKKLTKEEFSKEGAKCLSGLTKYTQTYFYKFQFQTVLEGEKFNWELSITPYEIKFLLFPFYENYDQYLLYLNDTKNLYSVYTTLYENPRLRNKSILFYGPKIDFTDFKKRINAANNWK